jgi:formylglycine-generating enzyme required for sulfatase activity
MIEACLVKPDERTTTNPPDEDLGANAMPGGTSKPNLSLTRFYLVLGLVVALGLVGLWFWRTWAVWWFDANGAKDRQAAASAKLGLPVERSVDLGDGIALDLVLIPAGRFQMGWPADDPDRNPGEPQHWVVITRPFYIGKYEITQEQWVKVMGEGPDVIKGERLPMNGVSWKSCQAFLARLNSLARERGQYHLPTEAQWEWACRAGTRTRFYYGDSQDKLADYAWFGEDDSRPLHPVGMKKPNAWNLYDCYGNVAEWSADLCGDGLYYWKSSLRDPTGPDKGDMDGRRMVRGGSWLDGSHECSSAYRYDYSPSSEASRLGLRVALDIVPVGAVPAVAAQRTGPGSAGPEEGRK